MSEPADIVDPLCSQCQEILAADGSCGYCALQRCQPVCASAPVKAPFEVSDDVLLLRAVRNCRSSLYNKGEKHPRWVAIMDTFALGSTYAHMLCRRFGYDPDEMVKR